MRKPKRRPPRRLDVEMREFWQHLLALGNQRVDAHIERRAARQRLALGAALVAKDPREIGIEPIRIFALHGLQAQS